MQDLEKKYTAKNVVAMVTASSANDPIHFS